MNNAPPRIAGLVLAAGRSTRMGYDKLALPVFGQTLLHHAVQAALDASLSPVVLVLGPSAPLPERDGLIVVRNPSPESGLSSSLIVGMRTLPVGLDGVVVLLGDMPLIRGDHIERLIAAFRGAAPRSMCVPVWKGRRGNPVLLGSGFFADVLTLTGDVGAKPLMNANPQSVIDVSMDDDAVTLDIDEPADLAAVSAHGQRR